MKRVTTIGLMTMALVISACETAPKTQQAKDDLEQDVQQTMARLELADPTLREFLDKSAGYAIFPSVGKGGFIVGGSYGRGLVYVAGQPVGYSDLSQATVGAQIGGQKYAQILAFETIRELNQFKQGELTFAANATAVALKSGVGKSAKYQDGVVVFVEPIAGLMAEASIGGQSFSYQPK